MEVLLELEAPGAQEIQAGGGQRANALFLDLVREVDDAMSARLHNMAAPKPYTVSSLMGEMESLGGGRVRIGTGKNYALRFTLLDDELVALWKDGLLSSLPGRALHLGEACFTIASVKGKTLHADDLYRECIVSRKAPPRKLTLSFVSPTSFRSGGRNFLFPLPRLVWHSANRAWSKVSRVDLGENVHLLADDGVCASRFSLSTRILHFDRSRQVGMVGRCEYLLRAADEDLRRALHLLARFSEYSGLGMKTTMGMGQTRFGVAGTGGGENMSVRPVE